MSKNTQFHNNCQCQLMVPNKPRICVNVLLSPVTRLPELPGDHCSLRFEWGHGDKARQPYYWEPMCLMFSAHLPAPPYSLIHAHGLISYTLATTHLTWVCTVVLFDIFLPTKAYPLSLPRLVTWQRVAVTTLKQSAKRSLSGALFTCT